MLDGHLRENAVIRPLIEEGRQQGRRDQLLAMLVEKFGGLQDSVSTRIQIAAPEQLERWSRRFARANSLEETLD